MSPMAPPQPHSARTVAQDAKASAPKQRKQVTDHIASETDKFESSLYQTSVDDSGAMPWLSAARATRPIYLIVFGGPGRDRTDDLPGRPGRASISVLRIDQTVWWTWSGSNRRPLPCHGSALPAAPQAHDWRGNSSIVVGGGWQVKPCTLGIWTLYSEYASGRIDKLLD